MSPAAARSSGPLCSFGSTIDTSRDCVPEEELWLKGLIREGSTNNSRSWWKVEVSLTGDGISNCSRYSSKAPQKEMEAKAAQFIKEGEVLQVTKGDSVLTMGSKTYHKFDVKWSRKFTQQAQNERDVMRR